MSSEETLESPEVEAPEIGNEAPVEPPPLAASEEEAAPVEVSKSVDEEGDVDGNNEANAYTPNYKLSVYEQEREVAEFLKPLMKDAETEEQIRDFCAKAYGLEFMKPKYEDLKEKYPQLEQKHEQFCGQIDEIANLRDKDLDAFFNAVGISEDKLAEHMLEKVKRLELPEDQRRVYDEFSETRRQKYDLEKQLQEERGRSQQVAVQARAHELGSILERPEIAAYAKSYDSARKQTGAFKDAVIRHATAEWNINKRDLGADQAVQDTMSFLGDVYRGQQAAPVVEQSSGAPLPVIPRVSGKSVSPVGKRPRSIEDLKKIASERFA